MPFQLGLSPAAALAIPQVLQVLALSQLRDYSVLVLLQEPSKKAHIQL